MSHSKREQSLKAEELFDKGKLTEALELFNDFFKDKITDMEQKSHFLFLKGLILIYQYKSEELVKYGETLYQESQKNDEKLQSIDGLCFKIAGLCLDFNFDEVFNLIDKVEKIQHEISNDIKDVLTQKEAFIRILKAWANLETGNIDLAERDLEYILNLKNKTGVTFEIVWATLIMARLLYQGKHEAFVSLEYTKKALSLAKSIKYNHFWIALCELFIGTYYTLSGELDRSLKHYMRSLETYRKLDNKSYIAATLNNLGANSMSLGDYPNALKFLEESLHYYEIQPIGIEFPLSNLVEFTLENNDTELAQKYFAQLERLYNHKKTDTVDIAYRLSKVLMLKRSSRIRDKAEAETILKEMIGVDRIWYNMTLEPIIHLSDLLLSEYRLTNDREVLDELNFYVGKMLERAEKTHSYIQFCNTFILQAKLALINLELKAARRFLSEAQKIAERYRLRPLAMKISQEHDMLLRQKEIWENFKDSEESYSDRWKLAGLNEQMENMVKKRVVKVPDLSDEESIFLLIISEGGEPVFSQKFVDDRSFEDHLFGGFLTTIDYFIKETFSEGLDRAMFGDYTLLM
ncbi:MAG: tetratricopeptide repeat protein, partial [Candidatus Thorarchaeota archaeon]